TWALPICVDLEHGEAGAPHEPVPDSGDGRGGEPGAGAGRPGGEVGGVEHTGPVDAGVGERVEGAVGVHRVGEQSDPELVGGRVVEVDGGVAGEDVGEGAVVDGGGGCSHAVLLVSRSGGR